LQRRLEQFERRLARLAAWLRASSRDPEQQRRQRDRRELLAAFLRAGLERAGVDPDEAASLRHLEDPDWPPFIMRRQPFVHPLRRVADRHRPRNLIETLFAETRRYHHAREPPNLRQASTYQLIGYYCFGDGAVRDEARSTCYPDLTRRSENVPIPSRREQEVDA
jgi:hypothetical protein